MPRAVSALVTISLLALLATPSTVGAPAVAGLVNGTGTASSFYIQSDGPGGALEGGGYDWALVCGDCFVRITILSEGFFAAPGMGALPPGEYELREYRGLIAFQQNAPGDYFVQLHGLAVVKPVER